MGRRFGSTPRLENTLSNFEVVDRRRSKEHHEEPVKLEETGPKGEWKDVAYVLAWMPSRDGSLMGIGRAVGIRSDGVGPFTADYVLPNIWKSGFDWTLEARKRLDTFLNCDCTRSGPCAVHRIYLPQWIKADSQRIEMHNSLPLPECVEVLMRAEVAAQAKKKESNLVVPG